MNDEETVNDPRLQQEKLEQVADQLGRAVRDAANTARQIISDMYGREEAMSWPIYVDEYRGVMCGQPEDVCSLDAENSIILAPWDPDDEYPKFTVTQLIDAIQEHIETDKAYKLEKEEEEQ